MSESAQPLAPWLQRQLRELLSRRGHAWLLHGPSGLGQHELSKALAQAWLCEHPSEEGACGHCPSCLGFDRHTHADLCVLMPETHTLSLGWPLDEKAQQEIDDKKRKPSKEIRVEAARQIAEKIVKEAAPSTPLAALAAKRSFFAEFSEERADAMAFLMSLNDPSFLTDPRFADPFTH